MVIERTYQGWLIKSLCSHPAIFPHISDDSCRDPHDWQPLLDEIVINLVARDEAGYLGFGIFLPRSHFLYEGHLGFLPRSYGESALHSFKLMIAWMWANTKALRIVGEICSGNKRAISFAKRAGFSQYGLNVKSHLKGGILLDRVCLGISKT